MKPKHFKKARKRVVTKRYLLSRARRLRITYYICDRLLMNCGLDETEYYVDKMIACSRKEDWYIKKLKEYENARKYTHR